MATYSIISDHLNDPQENSLPVHTTTQGPLADDWSRHKNTIKRLYIDEDRPLREVINIMAREHGHLGTMKMYKSRFTVWGFAKNNNASDMGFMIRKTMKREAIDKTSAFQVGSRHIDTDEVQRYSKRKRAEDQNFRLPSPSVPTPEHIVCLSPSSPTVRIIQSSQETSLAFNFEPSTITDEAYAVVEDFGQLSGATDTGHPDISQKQVIRASNSRGIQPKLVVGSSPSSYAKAPAHPSKLHHHRQATTDHHVRLLFAQRSPIPTTVTPPQAFYGPEQLLTTINIFLQGSFHRGKWRPSGHQKNSEVRKGLSANSGLAQDLFNLCMSAVRLVQKPASAGQGWRLFNRAFASIPDVLINAEQDSIWQLLNVIAILNNSGFVGVAAMLQNHVRDTARVVLSEGHPWRQICTRIMSIDPEEKALLQNTWRCVIDVQGHMLGRFDDYVIASYTEYIRRVHAGTELNRAEGLLRFLLKILEEACGKSSNAYLLVLHELASILILNNKFTDAEILCRDLLTQSRTTAQLARAWELLAFCRYFQSEYPVAEKYIWAAIVIGREAWSGDDTFTVHCIIVFSRWLREWGRDTEATKLEREIDELLKPTDVDPGDVSQTV